MENAQRKNQKILIFSFMQWIRSFILIDAHYIVPFIVTRQYTFIHLTLSLRSYPGGDLDRDLLPLCQGLIRVGAIKPWNMNGVRAIVCVQEFDALDGTTIPALFLNINTIEEQPTVADGVVPDPFEDDNIRGRVHGDGQWDNISFIAQYSLRGWVGQMQNWDGLFISWNAVCNASCTPRVPVANKDGVD